MKTRSGSPVTAGGPDHAHPLRPARRVRARLRVARPAARLRLAGRPRRRRDGGLVRSGPLPRRRVSGADRRAAFARAALCLPSPPQRRAAGAESRGCGSGRRSVVHQRRPNLPRRLLLLGAQCLRPRRLRAWHATLGAFHARGGGPALLPHPLGRSRRRVRGADAPRRPALTTRRVSDPGRCRRALLGPGLGRRISRGLVRRDAPCGRGGVSRRRARAGATG
jgi:hypothetical protein